MLANSRGALVTIQARDFERAVTFYTEVLGLGLAFRRGNAWAEVRAPGLTVGIEAAGDGTVVGGGTTAMVFEVRDIARVVDGLRARGVSFLGPVQATSFGRIASFADSEGNPIVLREPLGEAGESRGARTAARKAERGGTAKPKARASPRSRGKSRKRGTKEKTAKSAAGAKKRKAKR